MSKVNTWGERILNEVPTLCPKFTSAQVAERLKEKYRVAPTSYEIGGMMGKMKMIRRAGFMLDRSRAYTVKVQLYELVGVVSNG